MPKPFTLDTSGAVFLTDTKWVHGVRWPDLDAFTQGYVEALFAALGFGDGPEGEKARAKRGFVCNMTGAWCPSGCGSPCSYERVDALTGQVTQRREFNRLPGFSDLSPEALAMILADCAAIQAPDLRGTLNTPDAQRLGGMNFWAERRDDNWTVAGFPPLTVTLGHDGKVHLTPSQN